MNAGCAGKTVRSLENASYLSALEVCSRQGAIQIHVYLTLPYLPQTLYCMSGGTACVRVRIAMPAERDGQYAMRDAGVELEN